MSKCHWRACQHWRLQDHTQAVECPQCSVKALHVFTPLYNKVKGPRESIECNLAAGWGQMVTGGHSNLQETMSTIGVSVMTKKRETLGNVGAPNWKVCEFPHQVEHISGRDNIVYDMGLAYIGLKSLRVVLMCLWQNQHPSDKFQGMATACLGPFLCDYWIWGAAFPHLAEDFESLKSDTLPPLSVL